MTLNAKPRMNVVKREDKEEKLKAFIADFLATNIAGNGGHAWQLVARSIDSPVILALTALAPQINAAGFKVKTLLTHVEPSLADSTARHAIGFACELRISRDVRLLDAHEQLRIDHSTAWIGDCMRREPAKRDAYECYAANCTETADWSGKAFDRLWSRGEPMLRSEVVAAPLESPAPELDACVSQANQIPSTVVASTRH